MKMRTLGRDEVELFWTIDRREIHHNIYVMRDGEMVLTPYYFDVPGWASGHQEHETPILYAAFDRGGSFWGVFDGDDLVGAAANDAKLRGQHRDRIQLLWLHVGRDYRGKGIGAQLFEAARADARARGAKSMYVSATPTENTIDFYLRRGCQLAVPPDPELVALEPDDIHLVCAM